MSKKFNYEAVTVDKVNKYVSNMIKNPDAYRVMELLSDAKAVQNSPLMKEEDMDTLAMAMDELIVTPTPKEDMAVCKIINLILHKYNLELPKDDSECIEMMIQMIGDTIAENKLGSTTEIAYTAFSDVLQGLCHQDVMSSIDDQDVLETCAFIYFINAAASCTMENMYQEIAASAPKTDAKDESTKEEKKEKSSKTEKDTNNDITEEDKKAIDKIKEITVKYFEDVADIAGFKGDKREEFLNNMIADLDNGFATKFLNNTNQEQEKETRQVPIVSEQQKEKKSVPKRLTNDEIAVQLTDQLYEFAHSKLIGVTLCIDESYDSGAYLQNKITGYFLEELNKMPQDEVVGDSKFILDTLEEYANIVTEKSVKDTIDHIATELAKTTNGNNMGEVSEKLAILDNAKKKDMTIKKKWN